MKFYRLSSANGYEDYMLTDEYRSLALNDRFEETEPMLTEWGFKELTACTTGKNAPLGYCSEPVGALVLKGQAYEALKDIFADGAELLPVKYGNETWYLVHATSIEDDICFAETGRVVTHKAFQNGPKERALCDKYFFRLHDRYHDMIFTEKFVARINELKLTGVKFVEDGAFEETEQTTLHLQ